MAKGKRTRGGRSRLKRRFRAKLKRRRFIRQLNSVAEKKIKVVIGNQPSLIWNHPNQDPGIALINDNIPALGTGNNQRIGSKIFIRYVILEAFFAQIYPPLAELSGLVSHFIGKERYAFSSGFVAPADITASYNGLPCLNPYMLKNPFRKMKLYHRRLYPHARRIIEGDDGVNNYHAVSNHGSHTNAQIFRKKFKIMRTCTIQNIAALPRIDLSDIIWYPVHWNAEISLVVGQPNWAYRLTMSYTDV